VAASGPARGRGRAPSARQMQGKGGGVEVDYSGEENKYLGVICKRKLSYDLTDGSNECHITIYEALRRRVTSTEPLMRI
jgi:hypothetical protein